MQQLATPKYIHHQLDRWVTAEFCIVLSLPTLHGSKLGPQWLWQKRQKFKFTCVSLRVCGLLRRNSSWNLNTLLFYSWWWQTARYKQLEKKLMCSKVTFFFFFLCCTAVGTSPSEVLVGHFFHLKTHTLSFNMLFCEVSSLGMRSRTFLCLHVVTWDMPVAHGSNSIVLPFLVATWALLHFTHHPDNFWLLPLGDSMQINYQRNYLKGKKELLTIVCKFDLRVDINGWYEFDLEGYIWMSFLEWKF